MSPSILLPRNRREDVILYMETWADLVDEQAARPRRLGRYAFAIVMLKSALPMALHMRGHSLAFRSPRGRVVSWTLVDRPPHVPAGNLIVDAGSLLVDAAIASAGLCQPLDVVVEDAIREGRLVEVLADCAVPGAPVHALCLSGQQRTPRIRSFLDHFATNN